MGTPIPHNRARFDLDEIARVTGGSVVARAAGPTSIEGVSTDTRVLERGALFVPLAGERFDGHAHLAAAASAGARAALCEKDVAVPEGLAVVRVASTLAALGALARAHARRWRALGGRRAIAAITGSAGKTTTRVALAALLERMCPGEVHATYGNLNNLVGAPMVLLGLGEAHRLAVIELGTNAPGEIAALAAVAEPDAAIVTLVAAAHTEGLGSIDGVAAEKGALFAALSPEGLAIGNADDARVRRELERSPAGRRLTYGVASPADYRIARRELDGVTRARLRIERADGSAVDLVTPLLGEAGALACAAAIAAAEGLTGERVDGDLATDALARADVGAGAGRLVPRVLADGLWLIDDSYNANPASSCASIRAAAEIARASRRRLVLVLGEMRELGAEADAGHDEVGRAAAASGAAEVIAVAGHARRIADRVREAGVPARFTDDVAEAARAALAAVSPDDVVLVKGSRGVATERVVRALGDAHDEGRGGAGASP